MMTRTIKNLNRLVKGEVISLKLQKERPPRIKIGKIITGWMIKKAETLNPITHAMTNCLLFITPPSQFSFALLFISVFTK